MRRNTSIHENFQSLAADHAPRFRFGAGGPADWATWREQLLSAVRAALGKTPEAPPLNPEIVAEWREDGLIKQRVLLDVEKNLSLFALVYRPENSIGQLPGILACHGHGDYGKGSVMGLRGSSRRCDEIDRQNCDYGLQMAKAGFAVIAIDWRGFGERDDRYKPHCRDPIQKRDPCNIHFLRETMLGRSLLGMNVHDGMCALDYFCGLDFVDEANIGAMGLSFGGTMTTWMSLCDERIRAADILCYSDRFADFAMRDTNFCGSQITPGLYDLCDVPDLHGLIAPRPLLIEIGILDECFLIDSALACYHEVEKIYAAADASENLELDLFEGPHAWGGNRSVAFFRKHLAS